MLSAAAPLLRALPRGRWRAPLSLGVGVPFLLGSTPAAAAGSADIVLGGVTTWLGVLAALFTLLAPRQPADVAGAVAVLGIAATLFAVVVSHRRRGRAPAAIAALARERGAVVASPARRHWPIDAGQVLEAARARFLGLQAAWDAGDVQALGHLTTPDMLQELLQVLTTRASDATRTDVVTLHAELLDIEELGAAWLASVEFSGLIRESAERGAVPFRELWMLAATKEGAPSWRLARQQALF